MAVLGWIWWNLFKINSETIFKQFSKDLLLALEAHPRNTVVRLFVLKSGRKKSTFPYVISLPGLGEEFEMWSFVSCRACFAVGCRGFRVVSSGLWNGSSEICTGLRAETKNSPKNSLITITVSVFFSVAGSCLGTGTGEKDECNGSPPFLRVGDKALVQMSTHSEAEKSELHSSAKVPRLCYGGQ